MEIGRTGKGREENGELGGKEKTKRENPRRRKTERLSEAITSKRFEKAQDCLIQVTFTLLSKLKYSAHVQVSHLSGSGEFPPDRASRAAQEHGRAASWPPPGSVTELPGQSLGS